MAEHAVGFSIPTAEIVTEVLFGSTDSSPNCTDQERWFGDAAQRRCRNVSARQPASRPLAAGIPWPRLASSLQLPRPGDHDRVPEGMSSRRPESGLDRSRFREPIARPHRADFSLLRKVATDLSPPTHRGTSRRSCTDLPTAIRGAA